MRRKIQLLLLTSLLPLVKIYYKIKWSRFNIWSRARFGLAWNYYSKTILYEEREKLRKELLQQGINEDITFTAFINSGEVFIFLKKLTWLDKLRAFFLPFSCIDYFNRSGENNGIN